MLRRDADIAGQGETATRARRHAIDRGDDRFFHIDDALGDRVVATIEVLGELRDITRYVPLLEITKVLAGAEGFARAGDDDHAHVVIALGLLERILQLERELIVEGVIHLGAIERDRADVIGRLNGEHFEGC